jgi:hypothetical protein
MVYLPRHGGCGNNTLGNKILVWQYILLQHIVRGKCIYCYDIDRCMYHLLLQKYAWQVLILPCLATNIYGCKKP